MSIQRTTVALGAACSGMLVAVACTFPSISYENGTGGSGGPGSSSSLSPSSSVGSTTVSSSGSTVSTSSNGGSTSSHSGSSTSSSAVSSTSTTGSGMCAGSCGSFVCDKGTNMCLTFCEQDADCASSDDYCKDPGPSGTCLPRAAAGAACSSKDACASMVCGTTGTGGNCCIAACTVGGACGATSCTSVTGACVYPPASTACGGTCSGDMVTPAGTCNGMGVCESSNPTLCSGNLICQNGTSCYTTCGAANSTGDAKCQSGYYCDGSACQSKLGKGATCSRGPMCQSGTCGGTILMTCM